MPELSGAAWVRRFPTSRSVDDLTLDFKTKVNDFLAALSAAGAQVSIAATYRPPERAYLMHYSSAIAKGDIKPGAVPAMPGVDIQWDHGDLAASRKAAQEMATGYEIVFPPALTSRHTERLAIDMSITGIVGKTIAKADGTTTQISKASELHEVGASYGVHKLAGDPPHWSSDGH